MKVDTLYLKLKAFVRYWEDATVNGEDDTEQGDNIPCKKGDYWMPTINLKTGQIINWKKGITAFIHYKVCDECAYNIVNEDETILHSVEWGYVPKWLAPADDTPCGDYIIMRIDENGYIEDWIKPNT